VVTLPHELAADGGHGTISPRISVPDIERTSGARANGRSERELLSAHSLRIAFGNRIARLTPRDVSTSTISYCSGENSRRHLAKVGEPSNAQKSPMRRGRLRRYRTAVCRDLCE
jgi:hypothetical protein